MTTRHRSAWRRTVRRRRLARGAVSVVVPVAVAVTVGVVLAAASGRQAASLSATACTQAAAYQIPDTSGSYAPDAATTSAPATTAATSTPTATSEPATPDPSGSSGPASTAPTATSSASSAPAPTAPDSSGSSAPTATSSASPAPAPAESLAPSPCPSPTDPAGSPAAAAAASAASSGPRVPVAPNTFSNGATAQWQLGDVASVPVDGNGNLISLNQTPEQAASSMNCTLVVPGHPLTAAGLATPYQLGDGCSEANPNLQAFVEATILSPDGQVQVYNPLVITQGTTPAASPVRPRIPRGSQVIIDIGSNGTNLVLTGPGAQERGSGCVDALGQSVIGQVSACNAVSFYKLANLEIARHILRVPRLGTSLDGLSCEDTRNFALVDQDPSDNTYTQYLLNGNGQTAQATPANRDAMGSATITFNGSDNGLLGYFVDPANGCSPFEAPDSTSANLFQSSQALNELSARVNQRTQIGLIPPNDEMVLVGGNFSVAKTNVYRSIVDQPLLAQNANANLVAAAFCMNMVNIAPKHNLLDFARDASFTSPVPSVGDNLATFMGNRLSMSFTNLACNTFGLTDPVTVTLDGNDVATAVSYNTAFQQATIPASQAGYGYGSSQYGRRHHMVQNPSGM